MERVNGEQDKEEKLTCGNGELLKQIEYNNACENDIQWPFSDAVTELTVECTFLHAQRSVSVSKKSFITFMINDLNALCFLDDASHAGYTLKFHHVASRYLLKNPKCFPGATRKARRES